MRVAEQRPHLSGLQRFTSMSRPIDPAYLSNRALLAILPLLALVSAGLASVRDTGGGPLAAAFSGALLAFAAWALTRELAPDYDAAAFVALTLAWVGNVAFGVNRVLLLFVALLLVRIVNRSTGLPSRLFDTLAILGFCIWAATSTQQPLLLLVAFAAFALDAALDNPLRRHYLAAAACLGAFIWMLFGNPELIADKLIIRDWAWIAIFAGGISLVVSRSPAPVSYCDISPDRLDRTRVNAGLVVGFLIAIQALLSSGPSAWLETPIWLCIFAVLLSFALRHAKGRPKSTFLD